MRYLKLALGIYLALWALVFGVGSIAAAWTAWSTCRDPFVQGIAAVGRPVCTNAIHRSVGWGVVTILALAAAIPVLRYRDRRWFRRLAPASS